MTLAQGKADEQAAELAQVLRRERAGQSSIADAQAEVEELKAELGHMREAFGRLAQIFSLNEKRRWWNMVIYCCVVVTLFGFILVGMLAQRFSLKRRGGMVLAVLIALSMYIHSRWEVSSTIFAEALRSYVCMQHRPPLLVDSIHSCWEKVT